MRAKRVIWWLSLLIFVCSATWIAAYLYQVYFGARSIEKMAHEIAVLRASADREDPVVTSQEPGAVATPQPDAGDIEGADRQGDEQILAAYAALAEKNPDMAGWIYIEGTVVDYPVMHTPDDPEKYLHRNFEGRYAFAGLPFIDAACEPDAAAANLIVFAHNMRSGQMFAQLSDYLDPAFRQAHPLISLDTLTQRRTYEVIAVLQLEAIGRQEPSMRCYRQIDTTDPEAVKELNEYVQIFSVVRTGEFQVGDSILTLSTCKHASGTDRLVVMARMVSGTQGD
jgi:sortase B